MFRALRRIATSRTRTLCSRSSRAALLSLVTIGRTKPHLYRLMFTTPTGDPTAAILAADRRWDLFIDIVGCVVGPEQAGLESSGQLLDTIITLLPNGTWLRRVATTGRRCGPGLWRTGLRSCPPEDRRGCMIRRIRRDV